MMEDLSFLETAQEDLKQIVQPFQRELNLKQKQAEFIKQCIRCAGRDDFLQLDEMLKTKLAEQIKEDEILSSCEGVFDSLSSYANEKVEQYRIELVDDLTRLCREVDLEITIDFPKFTVLKGIDGEIDFGARCTRINKKTIKSIDPRRIVTAVSKLKRELYDGPYDPQEFIDSLYQVYREVMDTQNFAPGNSVPIQKFYLAYVLSLQNKNFFQNMEKGKFKGYSISQFSVDIWRFFQSGIVTTSNGYCLEFDPGRNKSLWLLDSQGEPRRITAIAFHKQEDL